MKRRIILFVLSFLGILNAHAQNEFYFDKWKAKGEIITKEVIFLMDATNTEEGAAINEKLGKLLSENLKNKGIPSHVTFDSDSTDSSALIIKFEMVKPAYVKLNTIGANIPRCHRFEISQINKIPKKKHRQIKTTLAIPVDKEATGLEQASNALATLIFESIQK